MACVKFQESFKLSPDQITLLEQWGDTLLLISTNYLVPLHELACEKFMQVCYYITVANLFFCFLTPDRAGSEHQSEFEWSAR